MSDLEVGLIILLVIGVIASNLAVLKYSAKFKMTQFGKDHKKPTNEKKPESIDKEKSQVSDKSKDDIQQFTYLSLPLICFQIQEIKTAL